MKKREIRDFARQGGQNLFFLLLLMSCLLPEFTAAQNWVQTPEIPAASLYAIAELNGALYAAADSAIYVSTNGGGTWAQTPAQPPSTRLYALHSSQGYLYIGTSGDGIFRSADGGGSWQALSSGLSGFAKSIAGLATRGDSLYAATNGSGVYALNLISPAEWKPFNSGLFQLGASSIICSGNTLLACIGAYVFFHQQGASAWQEATEDTLHGRIPLSLHRHGDYLYLGTTGGVYRSDLSTRGWQQADIRAQPDQDIQTFASQGSLLFAGLNYRNQHWIWSTADHGATWDIRSHEFAFVFTLFPANNRMWAGRRDGLWSIDMSVWTGIADREVQSPDVPTLMQNYPNPFNPATTIPFSLPAKAAVSLKVFDATGREAATLVSAELPAGSHAYTWNAEGRASGVFICRLQAGTFVETRKLILLK